MTAQRPLGLGTHIFVPDADAAAEFYRAAFGATELIRHHLPDGRILFVELAFGPDKLLLSQEIPELDARAPATVGGSPVMLLLELDDVTPPLPARSPGVRRSNDQWPRCSGASATGSCVTPTATAGLCAPVASSSLRTRSPNAYPARKPKSPRGRTLDSSQRTRAPQFSARIARTSRGRAAPGGCSTGWTYRRPPRA
jgi:hypothetical protein